MNLSNQSATEMISQEHVMELMEKMRRVKLMLHYFNVTDPVFDSKENSIELVLKISYSFLGSTGFIFNSLFTILVSRSRSLRFFPYHILVMNIFISNILMSLFCIPFTFLSLTKRTWTYGKAMCKLITWMQVRITIFLLK